jgi:hypothetical protein
MGAKDAGIIRQRLFMPHLPYTDSLDFALDRSILVLSAASSYAHALLHEILANGL